MADEHAEPIDADHAQPGAVAQIEVAGTLLNVVLLQAFHEADVRRAMSFVTNFGNWTLPDPLAAALATTTGRLEWIHITGELVILGGVPHIGEAAIDVPEMGGVADGLPGFLGGAAVVGRGSTPGAVRECFAEEQVAPDTRVVVLGRLSHGPRVHEVLWGWHEHHRDPDGWTWLSERLVAFGDLAAEDDKLL